MSSNCRCHIIALCDTLIITSNIYKQYKPLICYLLNRFVIKCITLLKIRCNLYSIHLVVPRINNVVIFIGDWNNCFVCGMKNTPKYYILQIQWNMSCCAFALRHHVMHRALRNTNRAIKRSWKMLNKCYFLKRPKERRWNNHVRCYRWVIQIYWSYLELCIIFALYLVIYCALSNSWWISFIIIS